MTPRKLTTIALFSLCISIVMTTSLGARSFNVLERRVFMEATQTLNMMFFCQEELSNADEDQAAFDEALQCIRDVTVEDVLFSDPAAGIAIVGIEPLLEFFTFIATTETDTSHLQNNFLVTDIDAGFPPGTGEIEVLVWSSSWRNIVIQRGPTGHTGPQFSQSKNLFTLRAEQPGEWKILSGIRFETVAPEPRPQFPAP